MTLRDLVLKMHADEKIMLRFLGDGDQIETTPEEIINECDFVDTAQVSRVWVSHNLYKALMVEIE